MPRKATIAGVDVAYEVIGEGTPLTLLHMIFDAKEFWVASGYAEQLCSSGRQLIVIDASGHGESSKPHQPEPYQLRRQADEVAAVLDDLKLEKTEVLGYSMGGFTALGLVCHHPDRLVSAAVGGALPYAQNLQPLRSVVAQGPAGWVEFLQSMASSPLPPHMRERVLANDQMALAAVVAEDRPDISDQVASATVPKLFFAGDKDPRHERCKEFAERTGSRFVSVPGAHHIQTLLERDVVVPEVLSFFREVNHARTP